MTFLSQQDTARTQTFISRVTQAMLAAAIAIQNEGDGQPNHVPRAQFALQVLNAPDTWGERFAQAVVSDGADYTADGTINTRVSAIWNAMAFQN